MFEGSRVREFEGSKVRGLEDLRVRGFEVPKVRGFAASKVRAPLRSRNLTVRFDWPDDLKSNGNETERPMKLNLFHLGPYTHTRDCEYL